jgi:hypothetical protein
MVLSTTETDQNTFTPNLDDAKASIGALSSDLGKKYRILYTKSFGPSETTTVIACSSSLPEARGFLAGAAYGLEICPKKYVIMSESEMGFELFDSMQPPNVAQTYRIAVDL